MSSPFSPSRPKCHFVHSAQVGSAGRCFEEQEGSLVPEMPRTELGDNAGGAASTDWALGWDHSGWAVVSLLPLSQAPSPRLACSGRAEPAGKGASQSSSGGRGSYWSGRPPEVGLLGEAAHRTAVAWGLSPPSVLELALSAP